MYGLYIHIPYCHRRCGYCDFYTAATNRGVPRKYVEALLRSFAKYAPKDDEGQPQRPSTVYFGGGTPSLLLAEQVDQILRVVNPLPEAEVTIEVNPESAELEKLKGYRRAGVNRLSFGVQTADEESLRRLGRLHTAEQAKQALKDGKKAGFDNISGDIMMALPQYSEQEFDDTLQLLQDGGVTHISAYLLKIEEGTPFGNNPPKGVPDADKAAAFYLYGVSKLKQAGYLQYEISNFAQKGYEGKHNLLYWNCCDYLGIGAAAHSCVGDKRFYFEPDTQAFVQGAAPMQDGICDGEDFIMMQLRLADGLREEQLKERYGMTLTKRQTAKLKEYEKAGYAKQTKEGWALTPEGLLVQNSILIELM